MAASYLVEPVPAVMAPDVLSSSTMDGTAAPAPISSATTEKEDAENLRFIEDVTTNVDAEQRRVLAEILGRNAEAEYLSQRCGGVTDRETFRARVPMAKYEDLAPYIRRVADGDRSAVLTGPGNPVTDMFTSSGTSGGERKMIPNVEDEVDRRYLLERLFATIMKQHVPGVAKGKALYFLHVSPESKTSCGLPARTVMTSYYKSRQFLTHPFPRNNTSPTAAILCDDTFQSTYAQMVCGLCQREEVLHVGAVFAVGLVRAVHFLQQNWERIADDIEAGELGRDAVTDVSVREAVAAVLRRPDPELAAFVRAECGGRGGDWAGIIRRVWPNVRYLGAIATGSMMQYVTTLNYYSGGLPVVSDIYGASEGDFSLNVRPFCDPSEVAYVVMPNMAYFEFLPLDAAGEEKEEEEQEERRLVELSQVQAGREYELVITTYAGLCRYCVGDVLRVTGFHNAAPMVRFLRRGNVGLSVDGEKTDEDELHRAMERASSLVLRARDDDVAVAEYTSRTCTKGVPGRYVVYWELRGTAAAAVDGEAMGRCCLEMEQALGAVYRQKRAASSPTIAPLEIRVVRPGTFQKLMDHALSRGTSLSQYKVPRCVTENPAIVELLDARVVSTHFSPAPPHWAPDQQ